MNRKNGIANNHCKAFMPRVGLAWDPTGNGEWSMRTGYGMFYIRFRTAQTLRQRSQ
jgi:hypothetical protein